MFAQDRWHNRIALMVTATTRSQHCLLEMDLEYLNVSGLLRHSEDTPDTLRGKESLPEIRTEVKLPKYDLPQLGGKKLS